VAETSVTVRARQQGERLRALRERMGVSKGHLMDALGFKSSRTYDLYEDGTSIIRLDRVEDWAAAFEMPVPVFLDAVLAGGDDPDWDFLAELQRLWPDNPEAVERTYHGLAQAPQDIQRTVISEIRRVLEDEQPRAVPEERVDYRAQAAG